MATTQVSPEQIRKIEMDSVYEIGIWAGINNANGAYYILTDKGVCQARSIRRRPDSEKHDNIVLAADQGKTLG